ncbi:hypothetical protein ABFW09_26220, partial [Mycolicibacterium fortuitum]
MNNEGRHSRSANDIRSAADRLGARENPPQRDNPPPQREKRPPARDPRPPARENAPTGRPSGPAAGRPGRPGVPPDDRLTT